MNEYAGYRGLVPGSAEAVARGHFMVDVGRWLRWRLKRKEREMGMGATPVLDPPSEELPAGYEWADPEEVQPGDVIRVMLHDPEHAYAMVVAQVNRRPVERSGGFDFYQANNEPGFPQYSCARMQVARLVRPSPRLFDVLRYTISYPGESVGEIASALDLGFKNTAGIVCKLRKLGHLAPTVKATDPDYGLVFPA